MIFLLTLLDDAGAPLAVREVETADGVGDFLREALLRAFAGMAADEERAITVRIAANVQPTLWSFADELP